MVRGHCVACATIRAMDADLGALVKKKVWMLGREDFDNLNANRVVKHLEGNVYELRINGSGRFGQRAFFFLTSCRGSQEAVVTEVAIRRALSFEAYIRRAEDMRVDWLSRNCKGQNAR